MSNYSRNVILKVRTVNANKLSKLKSQINGVESSTKRANASMLRMSGIATAVITAIAIQRLAQYADAWTNVENKLRQTTNSQQGLNEATEDMYRIAQSSRNQLEAVTQLYFRVSAAAKNFGATQEQAKVITESLANSLTASGLSASETASVLTQTSQAFNKGYLNGDEFRALAEAMPSVLDKMSKEMGVSRGELQKLGSEGKVTAAIMGNTLIKDIENSREVLKESTQSMGQSMTVLRNATIKVIGKFDDYVGATTGVADATQWIIDKFDAFAVALQSNKFDEILDAKFSGAIEDVVELSSEIGVTPAKVKKSFLELATFMADAAYDYVENVRAFIKLVAIEITTFVDKTTEAFTSVGSAIKAAFTGEDFEFNKDFDAKWEKIRLDRIAAILEERQVTKDNHDKIMAELDAEIAKHKEKQNARGGQTADDVGIIPDQPVKEDSTVIALQDRFQREADLRQIHHDIMESVEDGWREEHVAKILIQDQEDYARLEAEHTKLKGQLTIQQQEKLDLEAVFEKKRKWIAESSAKRLASSEKALNKQRISSTLSAFASLTQLNQKSQGLQRVSIIASTASAVMESYNNAGGYPWGVIPAGIMAAIGAKQLSQVGKKSGVASGGSGGAASTPPPSSPGLTSGALSASALVTTESNVTQELLNELRNRDPNELLPVEYVRTLFASMNENQLNGTA